MAGVMKSLAKKKADDAKGFKEFYKKYPTKEERAGHSYNISKKHREAESKGARKR